MATLRCTLGATIVLVATLMVHVRASDPELETDFQVPEGVNASTLDGSFFTSTLLRSVNHEEGVFAKVTPANVKGFQALSGLGVSFSKIIYPPRALNPLHTHPRGSELLFVVEGKLGAGMVDSTNKLYFQALRKGDLFVFPKGMVHFQFNLDEAQPAVAVAAFSSSNPGTIGLPENIFHSGISKKVLMNALGVSLDVIKKLLPSDIHSVTH